jgi:shikimate dehydrogenase
VTPPLTTATRLIALLGDPVAHSLSPVFQNAALAAAGLDGVYVALRCGRDEVPGLIRGIARAGGAGNVTLPHKEVAAETVEMPTSAVQRTGACNTWWLEEGKICGDNTDVPGVTSAVAALLGRDPAGARVLLVGAGGSARAALAAMIDARASEIVVANRSAARGQALVDALGNGRAPVRFAAPDSLDGESFDLAINATSLGLKSSDALPLALDGGPAIGAALDLVYSAASTPWVCGLQARGVPAADGLEMLIFQGAASFERWWGVPAPIEAMRASLTRPAAPVR